MTERVGEASLAVNSPRSVMTLNAVGRANGTGRNGTRNHPIGVVNCPSTFGLANPSLVDSWRKNGAPEIAKPRTHPTLHNSVAPSADSYHFAASPASSTASIKESVRVTSLIVNTAKPAVH